MSGVVDTLFIGPGPIMPTPPAPHDCLTPKAPHDGLSFEELSKSYNFMNTSDDRLLLARAVAEHLEGRPRPRALVDIGCGMGMGGDPAYQAALAPLVDTFVGIEPDPGVKFPEGVLTEQRSSTFEEAGLPGSAFDAAYSFMVMEHVEDPARFWREAFRCLKPGGAYFFATPNAAHYFTRVAGTARALKIDEVMLRLLRGKRAVEGYHYPTMYRCNRARDVRALARAAGFNDPVIAYAEKEGPTPYLPGPLKVVLKTFQAKRRMIKNPGALLTMLVKAVKP